MNALHSNQLKCLTHTRNDILYIQVNQVKPGKSIFYCEECISQDNDFVSSNFVRLKEVLEDSDQQYVINWPPLKEKEVQNSSYKLLREDHTEYFIDQVNQIESFFSELKQKLSKSIDELQKQLINNLMIISQQTSDIKQEIQEHQKVQDFREKLIYSKNNFKSIAENEKEIRSLIKEFEEMKDLNTTVIRQSCETINKLKDLVRKDILVKIEKEIFEGLEEISLTQVNIQKFNLFKNILPTLSFTRSKFISDEQELLAVKQDCQKDKICLKLDEKEQAKDQFSANYYSGCILKKNSTYSFNFKCNMNSTDLYEKSHGVVIGITSDQIKDTDFSSSNKLYFYLFSDKGSLILAKDNMNFIQGEMEYMPIDQEFNLSVCISSGRFELSAFSFDQQKSTLQPHLVDQLKSLEDEARLFVYFINNLDLTFTKAHSY